jgi:hypothetical protein
LTEEKDNFELCIKPLEEIKRKLVETTLLDPVHATLKYEDLTRAYTIRCAPYLHVRNNFILMTGEKLIPAVSEKNKGMVFDLWFGYHYPGIGDESLKYRRPFQRPPVERLETAENIRNWLATGIPDDPNETVEQMKEDLLQAEKLGISSSDNPVDPGKPSPSIKDPTLVRHTCIFRDLRQGSR